MHFKRTENLEAEPFESSGKLTARITRDTFQHLSIYFTIPAAFGETRKGVGYGEGAPTEECEWKSSKELSKVS